MLIAKPARTSSAPKVNDNKPNKTAVIKPAIIPAVKPAQTLSKV